MTGPSRNRFVLHAAVAYAVIATLWIFFSDLLLRSIMDPSLVATLGTAKGIVFVIVTSGLLILALRHAPKESSTPLMEAKAWPWPQTLIVCALTVGIAIVAGAIYRVQSVALSNSAYVQLQAVAKLKATGVAHWMDERRANARVLGGDPVFLDALARWRQSRDRGDELRLRDALRRFRTTYGFENIILLNVQGLQLIGDGRMLPAQMNLGTGIQETLRAGDVTFLDLSREQGGNTIHMAFLAPMYAGEGAKRKLLGIALFDMRPQDFLYPYLLSWPLPSVSGETLLFRTEGDNIVILNELRDQRDSALNIRIPLSNTKLPAAQYVNNHEHLIEGEDYRGARVLAAAISVPGTPWSLLSKVDKDEALGWARLLGLFLGTVILLGLAASAAFVGYLWQRQRLRAALSTIAERRADARVEERFRATFEQAAVGIGHMAPDGRYLRANACLCRMLGYTREELLAKNVRDVVFSEDLPQVLRHFESAQSGDTDEYTSERRYRRKNGDLIWVEATVSLTRGGDEQSSFFIVVATDITNRRRIEQALHDSEERFSLAMEGASDGLWDWNLLTDEIYYSPRWKSMLGYGEVELAHTLETWRNLIDPSDLPRVQAQIEAILDGSSDHYENECRLRHRDGHYVNILSRGFPVRRADGRAIRLVGTHVDISERKRTEDRLRQAAIVFTSSQEGVVITDAKGNIKAVNPAFCTITGYGEAELLSQNMRVLQSGRHGKEFYANLWGSVGKIGYWQGEIWNRRKNGELFPELLTISSVRDENSQVAGYVGSFTDITGIKQSEAQLEKLAHHDPLTGLPNRLLLRSRLDHAILRATRIGKHGAVLFLDLDRFKTVNDSLGHPAGDELLLAVARRLTERLRDTDTIARLGGDEFVILLEDLTGPDNAANVSQVLIDQLSKPFALKDAAEVYIGASIGISLFPDDSHDSDSLIQQADSALYQAKEDGRGVYRFYTAALTEAANTRLVLEARLRRAVERDEFVLHYQPLISIATRRILGVEALMRWQDPEKGMIPPAQFIPLAEETGVIVTLGAMALRVACRQMKAWLDAGLELETMAVNLSPRQFRQPDIQDQVRSILAETGLPARYLELEITEGAIMEQGLEAEGKLEWFRELGIRVAIDDFGTGYSSLAYLKRFRINKLKVDQSFVRNIAEGAADMEIAAAIIGLGKTLGLEVLAEGVETAAQLAFLEDKGCDAAQGYLFSRPVPAGEIPKLVQHHGGVRGAA